MSSRIRLSDEEYARRLTGALKLLLTTRKGNESIAAEVKLFPEQIGRTRTMLRVYGDLFTEAGQPVEEEMD